MSFESDLIDRDTNTEHFAFQLGRCSVRTSDDGCSVIFNDGVHDFVLTDSSFRQLCNITGLPIPFAQRIGGELLKLNFNYLLKDFGSAMNAALRDKPSNSIRAFVDPQYPYVSSYAIYKRIIAEVRDAYETVFEGMNDDIVSVTIMPESFEDDFGGSTIKGGIRFIHSDSWNGESPIRFQSIVYREKGDSLMILDTVSRKFRVSKKSEGDILSQSTEFSREASKHIQKMIDGLRASLDEHVERPESVIRRICKEAGLPKKVQNILIDQLTDTNYLATIGGSEPQNMHDVIALFMFVGTHNANISFGNSEQLLSIAGDLAVDHHKRCDRCGHTV